MPVRRFARKSEDNSRRGTLAQRSIERFSGEHAAAHGEINSLASYRLGDACRIADKNNGVGKRTSLGKVDGGRRRETHGLSRAAQEPI